MAWSCAQDFGNNECIQHFGREATSKQSNWKIEKQIWGSQREEVDGTGWGSCPVAGFSTSGVELCSYFIIPANKLSLSEL